MKHVKMRLINLTALLCLGLVAFAQEVQFDWGVYGLFDQVLVPFGNLNGACFGMQFALVTGDRSTGFDHC